MNGLYILLFAADVLQEDGATHSPPLLETPVPFSPSLYPSSCVGCDHFTAAGIQVSFIGPYVSFLPRPSLHHFSLSPHPQTSLIKEQQLLVIKAAGYQDKIRPSFYQRALWVGRKERARGAAGEECLQQYRMWQLNSSPWVTWLRWQPGEW